MEQTDSCKRGGGRWGLVELGEGISQNIYACPMVMDNDVRIDCGNGVAG